MTISPEVQQRLEQWAKAWRADYYAPKRYPGGDYWTPERMAEREAEEDARLEFAPGVKFIRVVSTSNRPYDRSAHAFVNPTTGEVFKTASWKKPAKDARYNLLDDASFELMLNRLDWAGGYLYKGR